MIKKAVYPKTKRIPLTGNKTIITEKVDGSNLGFGKLDNELYIMQRNTIYSLNELEDAKSICYKGLYQFLKDNGDSLKEALQENACIFGEWVGMGKLSYNDVFENRFLMFAKSNYNGSVEEIKNTNYRRDLFKYSFITQELPSFIGTVPVVKETVDLIDVKYLDSLYSKYVAEVNRNVEGFIINMQGGIVKYVRMKNGKLEDHFE